jgi:hemerythrin-like domain-containing protein
MAGPMQMYLYVHDAILREVAELELRAKELNRNDESEIRELAGRLDWFHTMARKHEDTEEEVLFPALNERMRFVAESYEYDHADFEVEVFGKIGNAVEVLTRANGSNERREGAALFYRQNVALHEHMRLHIAKENELLLPKLEAEFDVSEQAEIAGSMAGLIDPPLMGQLVAFMYRGQNLNDRVGMVGFLKGILAEEAFASLSDRLRALDESAWVEVTKRLPAA